MASHGRHRHCRLDGWLAAKVQTQLGILAVPVEQRPLDRLGLARQRLRPHPPPTLPRLPKHPRRPEEPHFRINSPLLKPWACPVREHGGALINVGSETSDAAVPLQGMYSASKHAVKGFTDALRIEVEADKLPISITLIKPTAIHTPFPENAKNYLEYEPQLPPPLYAPDLVAEAILHCAENPTRDFFVGGLAKVHASMALNTPRLHEKMNEAMIDSMQNSGEPATANRSDGLYDTNSRLSERGAQDRFVLEHSLYQQAKLHPLLTSTIAVAGGVALAAWLASRANSSTGLRA